MNQTRLVNNNRDSLVTLPNTTLPAPWKTYCKNLTNWKLLKSFSSSNFLQHVFQGAGNVVFGNVAKESLLKKK